MGFLLSVGTMHIASNILSGLLNKPRGVAPKTTPEFNRYNSLDKTLTFKDMRLDDVGIPKIPKDQFINSIGVGTAETITDLYSRISEDDKRLVDSVFASNNELSSKLDQINKNIKYLDENLQQSTSHLSALGKMGIEATDATTNNISIKESLLGGLESFFANVLGLFGGKDKSNEQFLGIMGSVPIGRLSKEVVDNYENIKNENLDIIGDIVDSGSKLNDIFSKSNKIVELEKKLHQNHELGYSLDLGSPSSKESVAEKEEEENKGDVLIEKINQFTEKLYNETKKRVDSKRFYYYELKVLDKNSMLLRALCLYKQEHLRGYKYFLSIPEHLDKMDKKYSTEGVVESNNFKISDNSVLIRILKNMFDYTGNGYINLSDTSMKGRVEEIISKADLSNISSINDTIISRMIKFLYSILDNRVSVETSNKFNTEFLRSIVDDNTKTNAEKERTIKTYITGSDLKTLELNENSEFPYLDATKNQLYLYGDFYKKDDISEIEDMLYGDKNQSKPTSTNIRSKIYNQDVNTNGVDLGANIGVNEESQNNTLSFDFGNSFKKVDDDFSNVNSKLDSIFENLMQIQEVTKINAGISLSKINQDSVSDNIPYFKGIMSSDGVGGEV